MSLLPEMNFPRTPKLVVIQTTSEGNLQLVGYRGHKKKGVAILDIDQETTPDGVKEVVEEFRQSIDAPLKGKKKQ